MDRKAIYKFTWTMILVLVLCLNIQAQNLVPNSSFEEFTECPEHTGRIINAVPWYNVSPSCDYYHECGTNGVGIPSNQGGGYARTGQAYVGFKVWCINDASGIHREILGIELLEPLSEEVPYRVEFYLSLLDSIWYASKNIGAYFSSAQPESNIDSIESYEPQVRYDGDFITDKEGWTRISGTFVAQGGERFMSIGNFDKYEDTEVLFVSGGGVNPWHSDVYWSCSEYFIDDVSVVPDSITGINDELGMQNDELSVYPNPNNGTFTVQLPLAATEEATMEVWSVSGQLVHVERLYPGSNRLQLNVADGLYLYRVMVNREPKWLGKISIGSEW